MKVEPNTTASSSMTTSNVHERTKVLLQTATFAFGEDRGKKIPVSILFDGGSQRSFVSKELQGRLGLKPEKIEKLNLNTFCSEMYETTFSDRVIVNLEVNDEVVSISALNSPDICLPLDFKVDIASYFFEFEGSVKVSGHSITSLRYADDVALIAGSTEELQDLVDRVRHESEKSGLFLNPKKTKVMKIRKKPNDNDETIIKINNEPIENVKKFTYLGVVFTDKYNDSMEIKRRLAIAKNVTVALTKIWKDKNICLRTKKRLLTSLVFPIATYGAECWWLKQSERNRIDSFELWCYRRLLRISWTEKKTSEEVLQQINC